MMIQQLIHNLPCKPIQTCHECPTWVEQYSKQGMNGHIGKSPPIGISFHTHESLTHIKLGFFKDFMTIVYTFVTFSNAKKAISNFYIVILGHTMHSKPLQIVCK